MPTGLTIALLSIALAAPAASGSAKFKLKAGAEGAICLECHGAFRDVLKRPVLHTPVKARNCTGCHSPHAAAHGKLLEAPADQICGTCHAVVPQKAVSVHRPVTEKGCVACHDAHGSSNKFVLLKPERELCGSCHKAIADGAAKAKYKHRPLEKDGCGACHDPHGSAKSGQLLKSAVPGLCTGCHKTNAPLFAQKHYGYPVAKANCTSCHDPHGSGVRGMLYDKVHAPVAKGMCGQCHEPAGSPTALQTRASGAALCRGCHGAKLTAIMGQNRLHQAVLDGPACLNCHSPHASKGSGLLRGTTTSVCGSCHADTIQRNEKAPTRHSPVDEGSCSLCHDPHSSSGPLLLVNQNHVEGCGTCHDFSKHSAHPMLEKKLPDGTTKPVVDQRNRNLRVDCLSCHRAHGTEHKKMLMNASQTEMCSRCHTQYQR